MEVAAVLSGVWQFLTSLWGVVASLGVVGLLGGLLVKRLAGPLAQRLAGSYVDHTLDRIGRRLARRQRVPDFVTEPLLAGPAVDVTDHGFRWLETAEFTDDTQVDREQCWRREFRFAEVHRDFVADRTPPEETDGSLTAQLIETLRSGESRVVIGAPGAGKSTVVKTVAERWQMGENDGDGVGSDRVGRVLYRDRRQGTPISDTADVAEAIRWSPEPVLVVVSDAARTPNLPVLELVVEFADDDEVSFLLDSRDHEWAAAADRARRAVSAERATEADLFDPSSPRGEEIVSAKGDLEQVSLGELNETETERVMQQFESVTGKTVQSDAAVVHERITTDSEASAMLLLSYFLPVGPVTVDTDEPTASLSRHVTEVYDDAMPRDTAETALSAEQRLRRQVALGVNVLNAAGLPVQVESLLGLASGDDEAAVVRSLLDEFEGTLLFGRERDGAYLATHELWSLLFLTRLQKDNPNARRHFEDCVNGLSAAPYDESRGQFLWEIFGIGRERPVLAPLFGTSEDSGIEVPGGHDRQLIANRRGLTNLGAGRWEIAETEFETVREQSTNTRTRATVLGNLGLIARRRGNYETAEEYHEESLALEEQLGSTAGKATSLGNLGLIARRRGNYETAEEYHEESLALFEQLGDTAGKAKSLTNLGLIARRRGNYETAEEYHEESLALFEQLGDTAGKAKSLTNLGLIARRRGNYETAEEYHEESLALEEQLGDTAGKAASLTNLGLIAQSRGNYETAEEYHEESLALEEQLGSTAGKATSLTNLAKVAGERENWHEARKKSERAAELTDDIGEFRKFLKADRNTIRAHLELDEHERAVERARESLTRIEQSDLSNLDDEREFREEVLDEHAS